ncbi:MAG: N-6 DNA methylase [Candidatus Gastranaerophilales bacterium]|nr:N-6 DNA methylase [Candidatus Gastranaerophilales bacterium]
MPNISSVIKAIQDIMRKDTGVDGDAQRLSQIVWMLFLKIFADKEEEAEIMNDDYKSPIAENYRWQTWAKDDEGMTGDELIAFINNDLFPYLQTLENQADKRALIIQNIFQDTYNYMKSGTLLRQVINKINEIDFNSSEDRHLFNDIYEQLLQSLQSAGNAGEYYTPRAVTQFIVDMINPQLGEKVLDPACGTGGFLACSIEHLKKQIQRAEDADSLNNNIYGIEKKPLPHQLCTTNMILHGIDTPINIKRDNTLSKPINNISPADRVDCIITNPPFGGIEEEGIENNFPASFRTRETADLFLIYIMKMLKPNGRAGVVLPDGSLFGEGVKTRIKEELLQECNLHTIIRLPNGVFNPYTGIKTNLLFFTKGTSTKEIWYYEHPLPKGIKNYSRSNPITIDEFLPEKQWWNNRVENEHAWKVSVETIIERSYNLDIINPYIKNNEIILSRDEIISEIQNSLNQCNSIFNKIKEVLADES